MNVRYQHAHVVTQKQASELAPRRVNFFKGRLTSNLQEEVWRQRRESAFQLHQQPKLSPHTLPLPCLGDPVMDVVCNKHNALGNCHFD